MFLPSSLRTGTDPAAHGRLPEEITRFLDLGVDGFFTDFAYIGVEARAAWRAKAKAPR